jgi:trehalose 6-phosphate phosphatase
VPTIDPHVRGRDAEAGSAPPGAAHPATAFALFLDVDGTLLHIADAPHRVRVDRDTVDLLAYAHSATRGGLALITGRSIADIDALFAPLAIPVAGQHGLERRDARGGVHRHGPAQLHLAPADRRRLDAFARRHPGVLIEDKGASIAVHYRLAPQAGAGLDALIATIVGRSRGALSIQPGKSVYEIRPAGRNKGTAIAEFMQEAPFRGRLPLFVGDDLTDEQGFDVVNRMGGVSFKVGAGRSRARRRLADVDATRAWLLRMLEEGMPDGE